MHSVKRGLCSTRRNAPVLLGLIVDTCWYFVTGLSGLAISSCLMEAVPMNPEISLPLTARSLFLARLVVFSSRRSFSLCRVTSRLHLSCSTSAYRDHSCRAHHGPRRRYRLGHAPVAARPLRFDGLLRDPLRLGAAGRSGRRRERDQSGHRRCALPEADPGCRFQQRQANGPEARHHVQRHADPGVQRSGV